MRTTRALIAVTAALAVTGALTATAQAQAPRDPTKPCPGAVNPLPGRDVRRPLPRIGEDQHQRRQQDACRGSATASTPSLPRPSSTCSSRAATASARASQPPATACRYGKTVWYDFNPDRRRRRLLVQAVGTGFNPVLSIVRVQHGRPAELPARRPRSRAPTRAAGPLEQLATKRVKRGRGYSIQLGGVGNGGGPLDFDVNLTPVPAPRDLKAGLPAHRQRDQARERPGLGQPQGARRGELQAAAARRSSAAARSSSTSAASRSGPGSKI